MSRPDRQSSAATTTLGGWLRGWSGRIVLLGALAFCVELAQSSGSMWGAVHLRDNLGASASTAAAGIAALMAGTTAGRLVGDPLRTRVGPARLFRVGGLLAGVGFGASLLFTVPGVVHWQARARPGLGGSGMAAQRGASGPLLAGTILSQPA